MKHHARAAVLVLSCFAVSLLVCQPAGAQDRAAARRARILFEQAREALNTGRFAEARDLLRRSLSIRRNTGSAFNLAVALRGTGQLLEAVETFDAILEDEYGRLKPQQREQAAQLRAETEADVAVLHIGVQGAERAEVRVDGRRVGQVRQEERLRWRVDPGPRVVTASAPGRETAEVRVEMRRGGSRELELTLEPTKAARTGVLIVEAGDPADVLEIVGVARGTGTLQRRLAPGAYEVEVRGEEGRRSSEVEVEPGQVLRVRLDADAAGPLASPWLWTGIGLAVAGLVTGAVFLFTERSEDPVSDPTWGVVETLGSRP